MAGASKIEQGISLEEFLAHPEIDERPYLEYLDGRIEAKVSPQSDHSILTKRLVQFLDESAKPRGLGEAFPELRCSFAGRSMVPDLIFLAIDHIGIDARGHMVKTVPRPPDVHVEIISPKQTIKKAHGKLIHSAAHGCPIGLLIHPDRETIDVYRPDQAPERLPSDGAIDFAPVLPGLRLPVAEVFGWLIMGPTK